MSVIFGMISGNGHALNPQISRLFIEAAKFKGKRKLKILKDADFIFGYFDFGEPERISIEDNGRYVVMMGGEAFGRKAAMMRLECEGAPDYHESPVKFLWFIYRKYGVDSFRWFDGHFCLVVYDTKEKKVTLIEDPVGQHPLFYVFQDHFFAFSSEYQILTEIPGWNREIDPQSICEFFSYGMILDGRTPLKNLCSLPYGTVLDWNNDNSVHLYRYEKWEYSTNPRLNLYDATDRIYRNMQESFLEKIEDGKIKELPISGGFDTRLILALLPKSKIRQFSYYTHCSPYLKEEEDKDVIVASLVAKSLGLEHQIRKLKPENLSIKDGEYFFEKIRPFNEYTNVNGHFSFLLKGYPIDHFSGNMKKFDELFEKSLRFYTSDDICQWAMENARRYPDRLLEFDSGNDEWLHLFLNSGQCFMNTYQGIGGGKWVNPVVFFLQNLRSPFQDASLLRNLLQTPHDYLHEGNLFLSIFHNFAPELLDIPFARIYFPKSNLFFGELKEIKHGSFYQTKRRRIWKHLFRDYLFSMDTWNRNIYGRKFRLALFAKWIVEYKLNEWFDMNFLSDHWRYKKIIPHNIDQTFVRLEAWLRTYHD